MPFVTRMFSSVKIKLRMYPFAENIYVTVDGEAYKVDEKGFMDRLRSTIQKSGHISIWLSNGKRDYAHRMVLLSWKGDPPYEKAIVRHLDGDPSNNHLSNLSWGSSKENAADTWKHNQEEPIRKLLDDKLLKKVVRELRSGSSTNTPKFGQNR